MEKMKIVEDLNAFSKIVKMLDEVQEIAVANNINVFTCVGFGAEGVIKVNMSLPMILELFAKTIVSVMEQNNIDVSDYPKVEAELIRFFRYALESK
jgi:hypothetical protein